MSPLGTRASLSHLFQAISLLSVSSYQSEEVQGREMFSALKKFGSEGGSLSENMVLSHGYKFSQALSVFCGPTEKISVIPLPSFMPKRRENKPHLQVFMKELFSYNVLYFDSRCPKTFARILGTVQCCFTI